MIKAIPAAIAVSLALLAQPVLASSDQPVSQETEQAVRAKLTEQGYDVRQIKMEDGGLEVYAIKDGVKMELYLDKDMNITRTKADD
jgi:hypothetical protein